jgi:hypothetical protein
MSQATVDARSGLVFVSGQVAWDVNGQVNGQGYGEQTRFALRNLATVLASAGCGVTGWRWRIRSDCGRWWFRTPTLTWMGSRPLARRFFGTLAMTARRLNSRS